LLSVAERLRVECEPWVSPTALIMSFSDPQQLPGHSDITRVIRLPPGDTDLQRLVETDRIAEAVIAGEMGLAAAFEALSELDTPPSRWAQALQVMAFGLVAAAVGGLLRLPWLDIAVAGFYGVLIGVLTLLGASRPRLREASDALLAMVATLVVVLVATFIAPLNQNTVIIASLIVLLPGLSLTNAMNELTSQHLVSGTARAAGALSTVLKLTLGTVIALYLAHLLGGSGAGGARAATAAAMGGMAGVGRRITGVCGAVPGARARLPAGDDFRRDGLSDLALRRAGLGQSGRNLPGRAGIDGGGERVCAVV